jgi:DNA polymerase III sliding clamp (beta) subunit (PCNA family)
MKFIKTTKTALLQLLEMAFHFAGAANLVLNQKEEGVGKVAILNLVFTLNKLEIQAFNMEAFINLTLPLEGNEGNAAYIFPGRLLIDTIKGVGGDEVLLGLDKDHLVVKSSEGQTALQEIAGDFPNPAKFTSYETQMPCERLAHALNMVVFACDRSDSRPTLNGVLVEMKDEKNMVLVGTDGFRISIFESELNWSQVSRKSYEKEFIIPFKTAGNLAVIFSKNTGVFKLGLSSDHKMMIEWENGYLLSVLVQGKFPDWKKVWEQNNKPTTKITFLTGFQNAVKAAKILAVGNEKKKPFITLDVNKERTNVESDSDLGKSKISLSPEFFGDGNLQIEFDGTYLPIQIEGEISIGLKAKHAPAVFESKEESGWHFLLMPVIHDTQPAS